MKKHVLLLSTLLALFSDVLAQKFSLEKQIPISEKLISGVLPNGMKYFIQQNSKPEKRVEFRLAVKAGSINEDNDQLGLAHFTEHMCFNGSQHFAKNELVNYLQRVGVQFGAHLNAYTSFDETVYILPVPSDDQNIVDSSLLILQDWASAVSFDSSEIEKERGIVLEEWRSSLGAEERMFNKLWPIILKGSKYAERLPIGTPEILKTFKRQTIMRYYQDWYRPDLMTIIAVGDFDPKIMEEKIKKLFGTIPNKPSIRVREKYKIPYQNKTVVALASDKEATESSLSLYYMHPEETTETWGSMRNELLYQIVSKIMEERFSDKLNKEGSPLIEGYAYYGNYLGDKSIFGVEGTSEEGKLKESLQSLMEEVSRVVLHGFNAAEFERAKASILSGYEKSYNEREKRRSEQVVWQYVNLFLKGDRTPTPEDAFEFAKITLPTLKIEEINALVKKWTDTKNQVVVITAPENEKTKMPTEAQVLAWMKEAEKMKPEKLKEKTIQQNLVKTKPAAGKIVSQKDNGLYGKEYVFENGLKIVLKKTDFKDDEVMVQGLAMGGHSVFQDQDYFSVQFSPQIIGKMGIGEFSSTDLDKFMSGKVARLTSFVDEASQGFRGQSSKKDVEYLLQMIHLHMSAPRKDEALFKTMIAQYKEYFKNLLINPEYYFSYQSAKELMGNHPRSASFPTEAEMDKISMEKALEAYQKLFSNPSGFTFVFVGNLEEADLLEKASLYLGGLPKKTEKLSFQNIGMRPVEGKLKKEFQKGKEPKSIVQIMLTGDYKNYNDDAFLLQSYADALDIKLVEVLREKFSGVYSPSVGLSQKVIPEARFNNYIYFSCAPENVEPLVEASLSEVKTILSNGPTETDLGKVKEANRRELEKNFKENTFWMGRMIGAYTYGLPMLNEQQLMERNNALTVEKVKSIANQYISLDKVKVFVLNPEK